MSCSKNSDTIVCNIFMCNSIAHENTPCSAPCLASSFRGQHRFGQGSDSSARRTDVWPQRHCCRLRLCQSVRRRLQRHWRPLQAHKPAESADARERAAAAGLLTGARSDDHYSHKAANHHRLPSGRLRAGAAKARARHSRPCSPAAELSLIATLFHN